MIMFIKATNELIYLCQRIRCSTLIDWIYWWLYSRCSWSCSGIRYGGRSWWRTLNLHYFFTINVPVLQSMYTYTIWILPPLNLNIDRLAWCYLLQYGCKLGMGTKPIKHTPTDGLPLPGQHFMLGLSSNLPDHTRLMHNTSSSHYLGHENPQGHHSLQMRPVKELPNSLGSK